MKNLEKIVFLVAIMIVSGISAAAQNRELGGARWDLERVNNRLVQNSSAFIEIDTANGRFTGNGGCNQIFGSVRISGPRVTFSSIGMTRRMCRLMPGAVPENKVVRALESTLRYQVTGRELTFYDRRGRAVLQFRRDVNRPERAGLADRKWMLETIGTRRTSVSVSDAFVVFDEQKRSAGGNSGCNVYGGSYYERNGSISITEIISTMRACEEGDKMDVERSLLNGLRNANRYEIRDSRLRLYRGTNLLLTFRGERK
jgi:heat shock protein HslJ